MNYDILRHGWHEESMTAGDHYSLYVQIDEWNGQYSLPSTVMLIREMNTWIKDVPALTTTINYILIVTS